MVSRDQTASKGVYKHSVHRVLAKASPGDMVKFSGLRSLLNIPHHWIGQCLTSVSTHQGKKEKKERKKKGKSKDS